MNEAKERFPEEVFDWFAGDPSPRVKDVVDGWLRETGQTEASLREFAPVGRPTRPVQAPEGWDALDLRLDALERPEPPTRTASAPARAGRPWARWAPLAAAAALVLAFGLGTLWPRLRAGSAPQALTRVVTPAGAQTSLELPGGVQVKLSYASVLTYTPSHDVREVHLEGEAYFSVPEGDRRNLLVHTPAGTVRDLGTEFNVRARGGVTSVAVAAGTVRLETPLGSVELATGQASSAEVGSAPEPAGPADLPVALDWIAGRLIFYETPLAKVAEELSLRYGIPFQVDAALADVRLTANIAMETAAAEAAESICLTIGARCTSSGESWRIAF